MLPLQHHSKLWLPLGRDLQNPVESRETPSLALTHERLMQASTVQRVSPTERWRQLHRRHYWLLPARGCTHRPYRLRTGSRRAWLRRRPCRRRLPPRQHGSSRAGGAGGTCRRDESAERRGRAAS